jgi:hypothetical protein
MESAATRALHDVTSAGHDSEWRSLQIRVYPPSSTLGHVAFDAQFSTDQLRLDDVNRLGVIDCVTAGLKATALLRHDSIVTTELFRRFLQNGQVPHSVCAVSATANLPRSLPVLEAWTVNALLLIWH